MVGEVKTFVGMSLAAIVGGVLGRKIGEYNATKQFKLRVSRDAIDDLNVAIQCLPDTLHDRLLIVWDEKHKMPLNINVVLPSDITQARNLNSRKKR